MSRIDMPAALRCIVVIAGLCEALASSTAHAQMREIGPQQQQPWRGVVRARHQAALATELSSPVAAVRVREGQRFKTNDVLVEFDCRRQKHELSALAATVAEATVTHASNVYLLSKSAANRNDVAIAEARLLKARSEHAALEQRLEGCVVSAPFDGIVVELTINAHEMPAPNRPLMTIVSDREFEVEMIVPSRALSLLTVGAQCDFVADETQRGYPISIVRAGGAIDPVSQTAKVYASFKTDHAEIVHGMSGTVKR